MEINAKGPNFVYAREFIKTYYGETLWKAVLESLPEQDQIIWNGILITMNSYPFSAFKSMCKALSSELKTSNFEEISRMYEYIADQSLNKLFKLFFKLTNPVFVISNYPKPWERFFDCGKVDVLKAIKGNAVIKFTVPEIFLDWLPPACLGYSRKAIKMSGGRNVTVEEQKKDQINAELWEVRYEILWIE